MEKKNKIIAICVVMIMAITFIIVGIKISIANPRTTTTKDNDVVTNNTKEEVASLLPTEGEL